MLKLRERNGQCLIALQRDALCKAFAAPLALKLEHQWNTLSHTELVASCWSSFAKLDGVVLLAVVGNFLNHVPTDLGHNLSSFWQNLQAAQAKVIKYDKETTGDAGKP